MKTIQTNGSNFPSSQLMTKNLSPIEILEEDLESFEKYTREVSN